MIIVFGPLSMDLVLAPQEAEGNKSYEINVGGAGARHALAAARSGAKVMTAGKTGKDDFGQKIKNMLKREGINIAGIGTASLPTGLCMIKGTQEDLISGANSEITADQVPDEVLNNRALIVMHSGTPARENELLATRVREHGAKSLLFLAAADHSLPDMLDYLVISEETARRLLERAELRPEEETAALVKRISAYSGASCILIAKNGTSYAYTAQEEAFSTTPPTDENITPARGAEDIFAGTLAACLQAGISMQNALTRAAAAAALFSKNRTLPYLGDVDEALGEARIL